MKSFVLLCCSLLVLSSAFSACNNPVNNGYLYDYPIAFKADTAYQTGEIGFALELAATVPNACWEVDRVNFVWRNDSVADVHLLCRHDISAICKNQDTTLRLKWPVIAPYSHTYIVNVFPSPYSSSYTSVTVKK